MNSDEQDQAINQLYQQRKASLDVPEMNLLKMNVQEHSPVASKATSDSRFSLTKLFIILLGGGFASFSLFAVMSYLTKAPTADNIVHENIVHYEQVEYEHDDLSELTQQAVNKELENIDAKLPTPPKTTDIARPSIIIEQDNLTKVEYSIDASAFVTVINETAIHLSINHQVAPKYPKSAIIEQQQGYVRLSYNVDANGKVLDIELIERKGPQAFATSAIKALSQWRYNITDVEKNIEADTNYQIMFKFVLPKNAEK